MSGKAEIYYPYIHSLYILLDRVIQKFGYSDDFMKNNEGEFHFNESQETRSKIWAIIKVFEQLGDYIKLYEKKTEEILFRKRSTLYLMIHSFTDLKKKILIEYRY